MNIKTYINDKNEEVLVKNENGIKYEVKHVPEEDDFEAMLGTLKFICI